MGKLYGSELSLNKTDERKEVELNCYTIVMWKVREEIPE